MLVGNQQAADTTSSPFMSDKSTWLRFWAFFYRSKLRHLPRVTRSWGLCPSVSYSLGDEAQHVLRRTVTPEVFLEGLSWSSVSMVWWPTPIGTIRQRLIIKLQPWAEDYFINNPLQIQWISVSTYSLCGRDTVASCMSPEIFSWGRHPGHGPCVNKLNNPVRTFPLWCGRTS